MGMDAKDQKKARRFRPMTRLGLAGVAIGNGFNVNPDVQCYQTMEAAWDSGIRYYDTSPLYGMGISEHRMSLFLTNRPRAESAIDSKPRNIQLLRIQTPHGDTTVPI